MDVAITGALGLAAAFFALWLGRRVPATERTLPAGSPTGTNIARAISTGRLPEQASAEDWEAELLWILIRERHMVWMVPLCAACSPRWGSSWLSACLGIPGSECSSPQRPWAWLSGFRF